MEKDFYKKPLEELTPEQSWEVFLFYRREYEQYGLFIPKLMKKAIDYIFDKGYNRKIYVINYGHNVLEMVADNKWPRTKPMISLVDRENKNATAFDFSKDYLIFTEPQDLDKHMREKYNIKNDLDFYNLYKNNKSALDEAREKMIKKEFNESELEKNLDEFIGMLLSGKKFGTK